MSHKPSNKNMVIIAPLSNLSERVRLNKLVRILFQLEGFKINFWGWDRGTNSSENDFEQVEKQIILQGGGEKNRKLLIWYVIWMIKVFAKAIFSKKSNYYYCLGFESAFPIAVANIIIKRKFIFDNADNISKIYNWPKPLLIIIEKLEKFTADKSTIHLVPGKTRVDIIKSNTRIIPNTPASFLLKNAESIASNKNYERGNVLTIYINGYLTKERGIDQVYEVIKKMDQNKIKIIVAGFLRSDSAKKLIRLTNVEYHGVISNEESLALYYKSHLCFTYYEPKSEVNLLAEPNKWGDCIATNTPFLTNSEILTAKEYIANEICISIPYYNTKELESFLSQVSNDLSLLEKYYKNIKKLKFEPWDVEIKSLLNSFLK